MFACNFIEQNDINFTMKKKIAFTQEVKNAVVIIFLFICIITAITASKQIKTAVLQAVSNCLNIIVPCLFPMLFFSFFILEAGFPKRLKDKISPLLNFLFGVSGDSLECIILGLFSGYNMAVKSAVNANKKGKITSEEAKRIALFFTNAGVSFSVLITGNVIYNDTDTGIRLPDSSILTTLSSSL